MVTGKGLYLLWKSTPFLTDLQCSFFNWCTVRTRRGFLKTSKEFSRQESVFSYPFLTISFEFCKKSHLWKVKAEKRSPRSRKIPNDDNAGGALVAAWPKTSSSFPRSKHTENKVNWRLSVASFIRATLSVQSTMAAANSSRWLVAVLDSFQRLTKVSGMRACSTLFYACDPQ